MNMTKIQFDTIRRLALAYGHEWAKWLDFSEVWPGTTRGAVAREYANPATAFQPGTEPDAEQLMVCALWAKWCDLHDRVEAGYVPTTEEIELISEPLFRDAHYPSTPEVCLTHETCTGRTRWEVLPTGTVHFEFLTHHPIGPDTEPKQRLICRARVTIGPSGTRYAMIDAHVPFAQWGEEHKTRIRRALSDVGCSASEVSRAIDAIQFNGPHVCRFDLSFTTGATVAA